MTRFAIHTDGEVCEVRDRGKVIAQRVPLSMCSEVIKSRCKGDAWRKAVRSMTSAFNGHGTQFAVRDADPWEVWINTRLTTFNERSRAMVRCIKSGNVQVRSDLYLQSRVSSKSRDCWSAKISSMNTRWNAEAYKDEWNEWCHNRCRSMAKRIRRKQERIEDDRQEAQGRFGGPELPVRVDWSGAYARERKR